MNEESYNMESSYFDQTVDEELSFYETQTDAIERITNKKVIELKELKATILKMSDESKTDIPTMPMISNVVNDLLFDIANETISHNECCQKGQAWRMPSRLTNRQISDLILAIYEVRLIIATEESLSESCIDSNSTTDDYAMLAIYNPVTGIYGINETSISRLIKQFYYDISTKDIKEVTNNLRTFAEKTTCCRDPDLIPFNNGIFNYKTKTLLPFSPKYVFIMKYNANYNPSATNVTIHNKDDGTDWDVVSWIAELSDDPDVVALIWKIIGACLRPCVKWNQAAFFYATNGNNGKGTLCSLIRNILGPGVHTSLAIDDFDKEFRLEATIGKYAIITDENPVGSYIDKSANMKAIISQDIVSVNRKNKIPIVFKPTLFVIQCLNDLPKIKDNTDSFWRRMVFVPFEKCFTGKERKYIKDTYLKRQDVIEFVVQKVMNLPEYYSLDCPDACKNLLDTAKLANNTVIQFWDEFKSQFVWDMLPLAFLYEVFKNWCTDVNPSGQIYSRQKFKEMLVPIVQDEFEFKERGTPSSVHHHKMDQPEPLILKYHIVDFMRPNYRGYDANIICTTQIKSEYRNVFVRI